MSEFFDRTGLAGGGKLSAVGAATDRRLPGEQGPGFRSRAVPAHARRRAEPGADAPVPDRRLAGGRAVPLVHVAEPAEDPFRPPSRRRHGAPLADAQHSGRTQPRRLLAALGRGPQREPGRDPGARRAGRTARAQPLVLAHLRQRLTGGGHGRHQLRHRRRHRRVVGAGLFERRLRKRLPQGRPQACHEVAQAPRPVRRCPPVGGAGDHLHPGRHQSQRRAAPATARRDLQELRLHVPVPRALHAAGGRAAPASSRSARSSLAHSGIPACSAGIPLVLKAPG